MPPLGWFPEQYFPAGSSPYWYFPSSFVLPPSTVPDGLAGELDRIAVDQPPSGGSRYPFAVAHPLSLLVEDLYLTFRQYAGIQYPLYLVWVWGVGTSDSSPTGYGPPTHTYDLRIQDSAGQVVFDSSEAASFEVAAWGQRRVAQWQTNDKLCRAVLAVDNIDSLPKEVAYHDAVLDPRVTNPSPVLVSSLTAGNDRFDGGLIPQLIAGYNVSLEVEPLVSTDGGRRRVGIRIDGAPGLGLGVLDSCDETTVNILRINQVTADNGGNFDLQTDSCLRAQPPLTLFDGGGDNTYSAYRGDNIATRLASRSTLVLADDCTACCECDDYFSAYMGLRRVWTSWAMKAAQLEQLRDRQQDNINRWNTAAACRQNQAGRLMLLPEAGCTAFVGGSYCNFSNCCLQNVELRFTVTRNNGPLDPDSLHLKQSLLTSADFSEDLDVLPSVYSTSEGTVFSYLFALLRAQTSAVARLRFCASCRDHDMLAATLSVHIEKGVDPNSAGPCPLPEPVQPTAPLTAIWAAAGLSTDDAYFITAQQAVAATAAAKGYDCGCLPAPSSASASSSLSDSISISLD